MEELILYLPYAHIALVVRKVVRKTSCLILCNSEGKAYPIPPACDIFGMRKGDKCLTILIRKVSDNLQLFFTFVKKLTEYR